MVTEDAILARGADEPRFLPIVSTEVLAKLDREIESELGARCVGVDQAIEINPFTAVARPSLSAEGLAKSSTQKFVFKGPKVRTEHRPPNYY
jgi:hypothetical protein